MKATTQQDYRERVLRVLIHIQAHLDEELALSDLAGLAAFFALYHFHRIFRGMVGESLRGHVRRVRLERAAGRLKHSDRPVTRIALEAGYESHEAFTRAFRAMFDASPSEFRHSHADTAPGASTSGVHYRADGRIEDFEPRGFGGESMKVEVEKLEPMRVAFVRHVGPYPECGRAWDELMPWAGAQGLLGAGTICLGLCHDDPAVTPPEKVRYDACITVDETFRPEGRVGVQGIEGGDYAVTTHHGPYDDLGIFYDRLFGEWMPRSGRQPRSAPCFEVYLNSPEDTEPEELLTDVYVPLEPRNGGA